MPVSLEQVRQALQTDEPNYERLARELGPEALPHLAVLVDSPDPALASKAASLAGAIGGEQAAPVLQKAARSADVRVRVAAAGAARNLPDAPASRVLQTLVQDPDPGVQKTALRSVPAAATPELQSALRGLSTRGTHPGLSGLVSEAIAGRGRSAQVPATPPPPAAPPPPPAPGAGQMPGGVMPGGAFSRAMEGGAPRGTAPGGGGEMPAGDMNAPRAAPSGGARAGDMPGGSM
jgi:hypothetical protein